LCGNKTLIDHIRDKLSYYDYCSYTLYNKGTETNVHLTECPCGNARFLQPYSGFRVHTSKLLILKESLFYAFFPEMAFKCKL
jgi:hypothetical protein